MCLCATWTCYCTLTASFSICAINMTANCRLQSRSSSIFYFFPNLTSGCAAVCFRQVAWPGIVWKVHFLSLCRKLLGFQMQSTSWKASVFPPLEVWRFQLLCEHHSRGRSMLLQKIALIFNVFILALDSWLLLFFILFYYYYYTLIQIWNNLWFTVYLIPYHQHPYSDVINFLLSFYLELQWPV